MATLKDLHEIIIRIPGVSEQTAIRIITEFQRSLPGEKVYITAPDTSKRAQIAQAVKTLPTSVVAERFGVTPQYARLVRSVTIKKRN